VELNTVPGSARETHQGRRSWTRLVGTTLAALAVGAASLALTAPAQGLNSAKTGDVDAANGGFPAYYTDDAGISLQPCIDGLAACGGATAADDGAGGPGMGAAPDGEGFYWSAEADLQTARGSLLVIMAQEAAWLSDTQPVVFDRLRVRGHLNRSGTYTLLTPYGSKKFEAGPVAEQRNVFDTEDLDCAMTAGGPCAGHITNWLRAVNAPAGYLGDAATPRRVTGGTVRNEVVLKSPAGKVLGRTKLFTVMGKLADGPAAVLGANSVDFGNTKAVTRRSITLKNAGNASLALQGLRVAGARTIKVAPTGCAARTSLGAGASCAVNLVYRPGRSKVSAGTLVVDDNTIAGLHRVPVTAMTSSVFSAQPRVQFTRLKVGSESHARRVVVTNTGVLPLKVKGVSITGHDARSFDRRSGQGPLCVKGARVKPGKACALYVAFAPKTFGVKTASLNVRTNAASSPDSVRLSGRGR
jgi:hypothetical protein